MLVASLVPLVQLLICVPAGMLAAAASVYTFGPQRRVAIHLLETLRELKKNR
jgi:hypothetical protein